MKMTTYGTGPTKVICAHSWIGSNVLFAPMLAHLDPDEATWAFPSFAGYGSGAEPVTWTSAAEMGGQLLSAAEILGWQTFHLVGHSMGGQAVQSILGDSEARDRVVTASLISSVPSYGSHLNSTEQAMFEDAARNPATMADVIHTQSGGRLGSGFSQYVAALSEHSTNEQTLLSYLRAWSQDDVSKGVSAFAGPVLVITGEIDPAVGPPVGEQIAAQFEDSKHLALSRIGHFPPLEDPAAVASAISGHIRAVR